MTDVLETELNNLLFRSQRAQAEFNSELGFVERLEQAANALREVRLEVMTRMADSLPPPTPIPWNGHHVEPSAIDWRLQ